MGQDTDQSRWARRPGWARSVRLAVFCAPVLASFGAALAVRALLPAPHGLGARAASLAVLVGVSTLVLLLVDRLGRRALPLVTLLDLSMLFPDRAPSRLGVAREAIRRRPIEEQLQRVREAGADPGAAARAILALVAAMSAHDRPTRGHAERVRMFTDLLAEQMRVPARDRDLLRWASILHDIGKLRVPATLLNKPAKPTEDEWLLLKAHPAHGAEMAAALLPWLGEWGAVIVEHHERYDGTGYPNGIAGREISIGARIVSVADAYDVMTAARAYRRPVSRAAACRELVRFSGSQFDPAVVRAMVAVGAPRLRRAQGVVAWVADLPLVATGTVPAATVARIVGAGALATGAVTGGVAVSGVEPVPPAAAVKASSSVSDRADGAGGSGRAGDPAPGAPARDAARTTPGPDPVAVAPAPAAASVAGTPVDAAHPSTVESPGVVAGDSGPDGAPDGAGPPAPSGSGSVPAATPRPRSGDTDPSQAPRPPSPAATSARVTDAVERTVGTTVGTVTGTVGTTVGTVTGTVGAVVADPVGTVTGVVSDPVGTDTGTVGTVTGTVGTVTGTVGTVTGSLLGSGSSGSGSSGRSGSGRGGLLGSLLDPLLED